MQRSYHLSLRSQSKDLPDNISDSNTFNNDSTNSEMQPNLAPKKSSKNAGLQNRSKGKARRSKADLSRSENERNEYRKKGKGARKNKAFTRQLWKNEEDDAIATLVKEYGTKKWTLIAHKLQEEYKIYGRTGKQCRER